MNIALAQQNYHIGNFEGNTRKILDGISKAKAAGVDLVVFSELCVCGYPPLDFLEFEDFISKCYAAVDRIREAADTIGVIVGSPARNPQKKGKELFNAAWLLYEKEIKGVAHKTCLPNYDVFDEYRYFEPGYEWKVIPFKGRRIALTVCEDIWNIGDNPQYRVCPMDQLILQHPDVMINISASPFDYDHDDDRKEVVRQNVLKYGLPMYYCNAIGAQTELVFDGGSVIYNERGDLIKELNYFEEDFAIVPLPEAEVEVPAEGPVPPLFEELLPGLSVAIDTSPSATERTGLHLQTQEIFDKDMRVAKQNDPDRILQYLVAEKNVAQIHQALILGIRDYFSKMGFTKAIIGSSGGIDSAVTLTLACEALGRDNVRAILMPSPYSSGHSVSDAEQLSRNLGNPYDIIPIREVYEALLSVLKPVCGDLPFGLAEENLQSRSRGNIVMGLANKFGYILLNTSNKSELATGYGTLYGDMAGGLSVLGDIYKGQVYALARYLNRNGEVIPRNILEKAPSAELRPGQKDSDSLPDYDILDKILYQYIERRQGPREITAMGIDEALVARVLKLVNSNEYKRKQFCPIIRVSCKAFGLGRRVPIVAKYLG
jgi:NAD+ synthase (glutamine-hydrolysing)